MRVPAAMRARPLLIAALGLALALTLPAAGCGSSRPSAAGSRRATLVLDFLPNAVHAGIYRALAEGLYRRAGIDLRIVQPTSTSDTLELIDAGRAQFGLADATDVAELVAGGGDAQAVMAVVQRPLGGLIARAGERLAGPAALQGRSVGVTGVPSDTAVLDTEVRHAGGDPSRVHVIGVGFNGPQALRAGRIDAFTGFWPDDGTTLALTGVPVSEFKLDEQGGPSFPGLVAFTTRRLQARDPRLVRAFVAATVRGYEETLRDPARSLADLLAANPTLDRRVTAGVLRAYEPLFTVPGVRFGTLRPAALQALSAWLVGNRVLSRPLDAGRLGTDAYLPAR